MNRHQQWDTSGNSVRSVNCGDAVDIPSATQPRSSLTDSQIGKYVRVKATGHNSTSPDAVSFSLASGPIAANTIAQRIPARRWCRGTVSGSVLSTTDGSWTGTSPITYGYQWQTCSTADCSGGTVTNVGNQQCLTDPVPPMSAPTHGSSSPLTTVPLMSRRLDTNRGHHRLALTPTLGARIDR